MLEQGGTVFDTAPGYGASEEVAAKAVNELGVRDRVFWATKLNVAGRGASADPARARAQVDTSFARLGRDKIDLIQVHNVADMATQFPILEEYKQAGRVRYIGTTTTFKPQYETLLQLMRDEPFDFIGIDYAVDNLDAEERVFPLAQERGIGVLVYLPFGRTRLVGPRRRARGAGVGRRVRRDDVGAVLPEVRGFASGRDGRDAGDEQAASHGRQHDGRARPLAGSSRAQANGRLHRCAARVGSERHFAGSCRPSANTMPAVTNTTPTSCSSRRRLVQQRDRDQQRERRHERREHGAARGAQDRDGARVQEQRDDRPTTRPGTRPE